MTVSKRIRYEVLRRDRHACRYCGAAAPDVKLTIDHVVPTALGGSDDPSNLVTACAACNSGKTSTSPDAPLVAEVNATALAWSAAMQQAADERAAAYAQNQVVAEEFRTLWNAWTWTDRKGQKHHIDLPADYANSVRTFLAAGLTMTDLDELIKVAMSTKGTTDEWRYFCGCAWKRIKAAQERAAEIVAEQSEGEEEDWDDSATEAEYWWTDAARRWRDQTGTSLRLCMCPEYCGKGGCQMNVAHLALGALMGVEQLKEYVTKLPATPAPKPAPPVDEPITEQPRRGIYDEEQFRVAEALEQELAELAEARRRARMHRRENEGGVFDGA